MTSPAGCLPCSTGTGPFVGIVVAAFVLPTLVACSKPELRTPLALGSDVPRAVVEHTVQGTQQYEQGQHEAASVSFRQAVAGAPDSAEAHYNLGLALFALGKTAEARRHFLEAANLAPGHRVIWDSPALRPYGSPEPALPSKPDRGPYPGGGPVFGGGAPR
ncbi:MAG: tetratricopeptide repeat protein [Nitrospiraceae bacterium]